MVRDITGQRVSERTLVNAAIILYEGLKDPVEEIKQSIINSGVMHSDETGIRSEESTKWIYVVSTDRTTYYVVHPKRGEKAANRYFARIQRYGSTCSLETILPYYGCM